MTIRVFSNNRSAKKWFSAIERSRKHEIAFHAASDLDVQLKSATGLTANSNGRELWYLDVSDFDESGIAKHGKKIRKLHAVLHGVVDSRNQLRDPAALLHGGAVDYIGKAGLDEGLTSKRLDAVEAFAASRNGNSGNGASAVEAKPRSAGRNGVTSPRRRNGTLSAVSRTGAKGHSSGGGTNSGTREDHVALKDDGPALRARVDGKHARTNGQGSVATLSGGFDEAATASAAANLRAVGGWEEIRAGVEYSFWLAFIQLDVPPELVARQSGEDARDLIDRFRRALSAHLHGAGGREWMWKSFGGLYLFPYTGDSGPFIALYRMMLNQNIINAEELSLVRPISLRVALDIGNTVYRPAGETGTIISDVVNFIFHLGQKFTADGHFYATNIARASAPEPLQRLILPAGSFENRSVHSVAVPRLRR